MIAVAEVDGRCRYEVVLLYMERCPGRDARVRCDDDMHLYGDACLR